MALQPKMIACGNSVATFAMAVRFLTGPAVMAAASIAVGLRGTLLHVAIVQVVKSLSRTTITTLSYFMFLFLAFYSGFAPIKLYNIIFNHAYITIVPHATYTSP